MKRQRQESGVIYLVGSVYQENNNDNNDDDDDNNNHNNNNNNNDHIEWPNLRILQSPHCSANCLQHKNSSGQGTILCKSCATH